MTLTTSDTKDSKPTVLRGITHSAGFIELTYGTLPGGPVWVAVKQVIYIQPAGTGTRLILGFSTNNVDAITVRESPAEVLNEMAWQVQK